MTEDRLKEVFVGGLSGNAEAYRRFLEALTGHLRAYLRRRLSGLPDEVEDLLQELLFAIHNQRHTYDTTQPLTPWIQAIARYKIVDLHRRRARHESLQDPLEDHLPILGETDQEATTTHYDVAKLLELLPDRQRLPILCVKIEGSSVRDAAQRIGMSESAVKIGIHRGLKALAAKLRSLT